MAGRLSSATRRSAAIAGQILVYVLLWAGLVMLGTGPPRVLSRQLLPPQPLETP